MYNIICLYIKIQVICNNILKDYNNHLYLSLGLVKKMVIPINQIASITTDNILLKEKINTKTTIEFVARDLEEVNPHMILELKKPCNAILFLGFEKSYDRVAIRLDDPTGFHTMLNEYLT